MRKNNNASRFRLLFICEDADGDNDAHFAYIHNGEIILIGVGADTCNVMFPYRSSTCRGAS